MATTGAGRTRVRWAIRKALTPTFDRIAREGIVFTHTFNPVPSCSPTRSCLLTGRSAHELGERASLQSGFPRDTAVVTRILQDAGYEIGYSGKAPRRD